MLRYYEYNKNVRLPDADYTLESIDILDDLLRVMTPKFDGQWTIVFVNIRIKEAKKLAADKVIPEFVDCYVYLQKQKLDTFLLEYPMYAVKELTVKDMYLDLVSHMKHPFDKYALWYVYNAVGHRIEELKKALDTLDEECTSDIIRIADVQKHFNFTKRVYTNQVLADFLQKSRWRWQHYEKWVNELGLSYAYNSMYKQITLLLKDKNAYLHNEQTKNYLAEKVDGESIAELYALFVNSKSYFQLGSILYTFETLDNKKFKAVIERSL